MKRGRKKLPREAKLVTKTFACSPVDWVKLGKAARRLKVTRSELVRRAVSDYVAGNKIRGERIEIYD